MTRTLACLLLFAACSSAPVDLTGLYLAGFYERGPCTEEAEEVADSGYEIAITALDDGFEMVLADGYPRVFVLDQPIDAGWRGVQASGNVGGEAPTCLLSYGVATAVLDGTQLRFEERVYTQSLPASYPACTMQEAARRNTSMRCERRTGLRARRE